MKKLTACLLMFALLPLGLTMARTWTSVSGAKLDADYVGRDGPAVFLKKANGAQIKIHIEKLSDADRHYLKTLDQPAGDAAQPAAPAKQPDGKAPLFGGVAYAPVPTLTTEAFPQVPLKQPDTATYWGFQYGPSAEEVLYIVFDQPTMQDLHDTAYLYSPNHPRYRTPTPLPGKKGKFEEDRVFRFSDIQLQAKHGDVNARYELEFVYGIERQDIVTVFVHAQLARRAGTSKFLTGYHINEQVVFEGEIPVVQALRPITLTVSAKNSFGKVDVSANLRMGDWQFLPQSGMGKDILVQVVDTETSRVAEKVKIEFFEDAITSTRHGGPTTRLEKVKRGKSYEVQGSINLGTILGEFTHSTKLKMPEEEDDD